MSLWPRGEVQNLVDPLLKSDQISRHEFIACAGEFVPVTNVEQFPQTLVGIEAHAIAIGDGNEHEIQKFFRAG
jgi:hypothetical protein